MTAEHQFLGLPKDFWTNIRTISEQVGYTIRGAGQIKVPAPQEIKAVLGKLGLSAAHLFTADEQPTQLGETVGAILNTALAY